MKKNDWIMIAAVIGIAAVFMGIHFFGKEKGNGIAEVQIDGELYGAYPLDEDTTIEIGDTNRMEIQDGTARMLWASCPDQVCVEHKEISRDGESIICLPNKVVISIADGETAETDAVVN